MFVTGSTLTSRKYETDTDRETDCTGEYTIQTYTVGACSAGGVKYQIIPGTASLVPSLAPTAFSSALTLELSGYSVATKYSDNKCTMIASAVSYPLNSCNDYENMIGVRGYAKYTATAYTIARTEYSDPLCKTATSALGPVYIDYMSTCSNNISYALSSTIDVVNANGVPPSSLTMASIRLVCIMSLSCVMASLLCPLLLPSLFTVINTTLNGIILYHIISSQAGLLSQPLTARYYILSTLHAIGWHMNRCYLRHVTY